VSQTSRSTFESPARCDWSRTTQPRSGSRAGVSGEHTDRSHYRPAPYYPRTRNAPEWRGQIPSRSAPGIGPQLVAPPMSAIGRSAAFPGRSRLRTFWRSDFLQHRPSIAPCCARGRAPSATNGCGICVSVGTRSIRVPLCRHRRRERREHHSLSRSRRCSLRSPPSARGSDLSKTALSIGRDSQV